MSSNTLYGLIAGGVIGSIIGFGFGIAIGDNAVTLAKKNDYNQLEVETERCYQRGFNNGVTNATPHSVILRDLNEDGIYDLVTFSKNGTKVFLGQDSSYSNFISLERYKFLKSRELEAETSSKQSSLDNEIKKIEATLFGGKQ